MVYFVVGFVGEVFNVWLLNSDVGVGEIEEIENVEMYIGEDGWFKERWKWEIVILRIWYRIERFFELDLDKMVGKVFVYIDFEFLSVSFVIFFIEFISWWDV